MVPNRFPIFPWLTPPDRVSTQVNMGLSEKEASTKTQMESSSLSQTPKRWQGLKIHLSPSLFSKRQSMGLFVVSLDPNRRQDWMVFLLLQISVASLSLQPKTGWLLLLFVFPLLSAELHLKIPTETPCMVFFRGGYDWICVLHIMSRCWIQYSCRYL